MKSVTKLALVKAILFLLTTSATAQTTITTANAFVPNGPGELGIVEIERFQFSGQPTTTYLIYSFCYITAQTSCLRGFGYIPNSAFTGTLSANKPHDVLTLEVDTNAVPGFSNQLCLLPDPTADGGCDGGFVAASGGGISVTLNKTIDVFDSFIGSEVDKEFGVTTVNSKSSQYQFSARAAGTVVGVVIDSSYVGPRLFLSVYATGKVKKTSPFLDPKIVRTLQQTSGTK